MTWRFDLIYPGIEPNGDIRYKKCLIYFSQWGTKKKIARAIHKGMSQVADPCHIVTVKEADPKELRGTI